MRYIRRCGGEMVSVVAVLALMVGLLLPLGAAAWMPEREARPQVGFIVDSSADDANAHDKNPGDGSCLSWLDECTLRAAIEEANALNGEELITFDSGMTVYLYGALPAISDTATIDASGVWDAINDQPGVVLNGGGSIAHGLQLSVDACGVYGLYITNFQQGGILVTTANNTIGHSTTGHRNVISGNGEGVMFFGDGADNNTVQANWIGLDITGSSANPNNIGISFYDAASNNVIGGDSVTKGNIISGNTTHGVFISGSGSHANSFGGNTIGLTANGLSPLPNGGAGILVHQGVHNTSIGSPLATNTIASNTGGGVWVDGGQGSSIRGNKINSNGTQGVYLGNSPYNNLYQNEIAYNSVEGVLVLGATATGNLIEANSIHNNGAEGIRLSDGGNNNLAAPTITSASPTGASGTACANCSVQIFEDSADEGETYRGSVIADGSGAWSFNVSLTGPNVTATNIDSANNTSQFSTPVPVGGACTPVTGVTISGPTSGFVGASYAFSATVSPPDATQPSYTWTPAPATGQGTSSATYSWTSSGSYKIQVDVSNCGGSGTASDTHDVTISQASSLVFLPVVYK